MIKEFKGDYMFLSKYVSDLYFRMILDTYDEGFLKSLDEVKFLEIYYLFKKYNFYFIDDIILKYLEIFQMSYQEVGKKIILLRNKLGDDFVNIIGNDLTYLDLFLD